MNNLAKSFSIVNKIVELILGSNFNTPVERTLEEYSPLDFIN